jgi:hypothetical protein
VISDRMLNFIIVVVTLVWTVNFMVAFLPGDRYQSDQAINAIFAGIVGGCVAIKRGQRGKGGDDG